MKKLFVILLAAMLLMTACGSSEETKAPEGQSTEAGSNSGKEYAFTVNGVEIAMHAEAAPIVEKLGGSPAYFESESCAFKGLDKQYDYGSYVIYTYPKDDVDYVLSVELKDDTVEAQGGLCIGSTKDDVIKAIAKRQPLRAVFRDSSFNGSPAKINVGEIFKMLAPDTRVKVI